MIKTVINLARDFSEVPAGRFYRDGPFSGEKFREELLAPALEKYDMVELNLDGCAGFGSSFLDEAFGGLVREKGFSPAQVLAKLRIVSSKDIYPRRIFNYISNASSPTFRNRVAKRLAFA